MSTPYEVEIRLATGGPRAVLIIPGLSFRLAHREMERAIEKRPTAWTEARIVRTRDHRELTLKKRAPCGRVVCAWCRTGLGVAPRLKDGETTHGMCPRCETRERAVLRSLKMPNERSFDRGGSMWIERPGTDGVHVELRGRFKRGCEPTGPSYESGGDPGEPDRVEDIEASIDGGKTWGFILSEKEEARAEESMLDA